MENKLSIKTCSIVFVSSFILCNLATIFLLFLTMSCYAILGLEFSTSVSSTAEFVLLSNLITNGCLAIIFFVCKKKNEIKFDYHTNFKKILIYVLVAIVAYFCLAPIVNSTSYVLIKWGIKQSTISYPLSTQNYFISILSMCVLPAVCEELVFRCIICAGLTKKSSTFAIVVSAVMFSIFHMSLHQTMYPFFMGMLLAYVLIKENNPLYGMIIHFVNNFIALTLSYLKISIFSAHWWYFVVAILLFIGVVVLSVFVLSKQFKFATPTNTNPDNDERKHLSKEDFCYLSVSISIMLIFWLIINIIV